PTSSRTRALPASLGSPGDLAARGCSDPGEEVMDQICLSSPSLQSCLYPRLPLNDSTLARRVPFATAAMLDTPDTSTVRIRGRYVLLLGGLSGKPCSNRSRESDLGGDCRGARVDHRPNRGQPKNGNLQRTGRTGCPRVAWAGAGTSEDSARRFFRPPPEGALPARDSRT